MQLILTLFWQVFYLVVTVLAMIFLWTMVPALSYALLFCALMQSVGTVSILRKIIKIFARS